MSLLKAVGAWCLMHRITNPHDQQESGFFQISCKNSSITCHCERLQRLIAVASEAARRVGFGYCGACGGGGGDLCKNFDHLS